METTNSKKKIFIIILIIILLALLVLILLPTIGNYYDRPDGLIPVQTINNTDFNDVYASEILIIDSLDSSRADPKIKTVEPMSVKNSLKLTHDDISYMTLYSEQYDYRIYYDITKDNEEYGVLKSAHDIDGTLIGIYAKQIDESSNNYLLSTYFYYNGNKYVIRKNNNISQSNIDTVETELQNLATDLIRNG